MKTDPHNEHRAEAERLRRKYRRIFRRLTDRTRAGDDAASRELVRRLAEYGAALRQIGYRQVGENEPGRPGRVVAITEEWLAGQRRSETETARLTRLVREGKVEPVELVRHLGEQL